MSEKQVSLTDAFLAASRKDRVAIWNGIHEAKNAAHFRSGLVMATAGSR